MKPVSYCHKPSEFYGFDTKMVMDDYGDRVVFYTYAEEYEAPFIGAFTVAVFHVKFKKELAA